MLGKLLGDNRNASSSQNLLGVTPPPLKTGHLDPAKVHHYEPGDKIGGRYDVVKVLSGGMAMVYLCADQLNQGMPVALKSFKPKFLPDRKTRDRFLREGTIWVGLKYHPNIVQAYRVERLKGGLEIYLVLEWVAQVEGKEDASLRSWILPHKPLSLEQALTFALHIARGMNYAVTKIPGFIHRDLKPENILIGQDGYARVTDFGLSSVLASLKTGAAEPGRGKVNLHQTQFTMGVVGTPLYMAPEQWIKGTKLDMRADIYAFGCILYEMLTGQKAIQGQTVHEIARAHQMGEVKEVPANFPAEIRALLKGCLSVWLDKRFQNWSDVERGLTLVYQRLVNQTVPELRPKNNLPESESERTTAGWSYDAMGLSYYDIGNYDLAAGYFERVIWLGRKEKDPLLQGAGLSHLGIACHAMGDLQGAIDLHEQHLMLAQKTGNKAAESDALGNLGKVYNDLGDIKQARVSFQGQLSLVQEIGDTVREGAAYRNLGDMYLASKEIEQALKVYKQALNIFRQLEQRLNEGRLLGKIGMVYASLNKMERAIQYNEQALNIAKEIGDRTGEGRAYKHLGHIHRQTDNSQRALWYLVNYLHITQETRDKIGQADVLAELGQVYLSVGETDMAVESFQQALPLARKIGNYNNIGYILSGLGQSYINNGDSWQAIGFFHESLNMFEKAEHAIQIVDSAYKLANLYREAKDFKQAHKCYEKALSAMLQVSNDRLKAKIKFDYAISLALSGNHNSALDQAEQAEYLFNELKDTRNIKKTRALIAEIKGKRRWF